MARQVTANASTPRGSDFANSSCKTYRTFPVIVKMVQVAVGLLCVVLAAYDVIQNFENLTARAFTTVAGSQLGALGRTILKKVVKPVLNIDHLFIDQMSCRIIFVTVSTILLTISAIQLIWFPVSLFSGPMKSRIISGVVYHFIGFLLHLAISVNLLARINLLNTHFYNEDLMRNVVWIGLFIAMLYLFSGLTALWYLKRSKSHGAKSTFQSRCGTFQQPIEKDVRLIPGKIAPK